MTEPLPTALKIPEVSRFINRANQLRTVKPAIAYWCEYHAVNQIVGKSLHTTDDDCFNFTKTLIERLEATKLERADDDAVVDNDAGQAYVEQFAQETFGRAERTLRANKVTRQTADTFDAAATFFDLTREWGPPDPETLQKIKFAKWNAARILKAIRGGKDPNESNPQPPAQELEPALSLDDPSVQHLLGPRPLQSTVEDMPDANDAGPEPPVAPPPLAQEGYFPPDPSAPPDLTAFVPSPRPEAPGAPPPFSPLANPAPFAGPQANAQSPHQIPTKSPPQLAPSSPGVLAPGIWTSPSWSPVVPPAALGTAPAAFTPAVSAMNHRDINQAQKHAKWAISALNFEDVPTAVKELKDALAMLGAQ
ncbi:vta1 like domain-containing protein [Hirsutella rhossiliensis]|uniref:Vta1 like domain-containing protein n=1 Tax=Hirsutella rhossiliensis TaxID=111463 RepID=A0A9P8MMS3_9HYPO|nr:vta1 like domain-containing protein [Hirsutella rhossiliensis]KAH0959083.1 vta1 like domain-containing protein [Hirsutella rhossiliensis]